MTERRHNFEVWSDGIDEAMQGIGSDPYSGAGSMGLRVPILATPGIGSRYSFLACGFQLPPRARATIHGLRQFASLGVKITPGTGSGPPVIVEQEIITPNFTLPDGNISWHLRFVDPITLDKFRFGKGPNDLDQLRYRMSHNPALLYESVVVPAGGFYPELTSYTPPNLGRPYGEPLGHLGTFHDLRWPWRDEGSWTSLEIPVSGAGFYGLFISVRQSSGVYSLPTPRVPGLGGSVEQNFLQNYGLSLPLATSTGVIFWRVAASLRVSIDHARGKK